MKKKISTLAGGGGQLRTKQREMLKELRDKPPETQTKPTKTQEEQHEMQTEQQEMEIEQQEMKKEMQNARQDATLSPTQSKRQRVKSVMLIGKATEMKGERQGMKRGQQEERDPTLTQMPTKRSQLLRR